MLNDCPTLQPRDEPPIPTLVKITDVRYSCRIEACEIGDVGKCRVTSVDQFHRIDPGSAPWRTGNGSR